MHLKEKIDRLGDSLVRVFQVAALFVIGGTIVWSAAHSFIEMMHAGRAKLDEILLLTLAVLVLQIAASRFTPSNGRAAPHDETVDTVDKSASRQNAPARNT